MNNIRLFIIGSSLMLILWLGASFSTNFSAESAVENKGQAALQPEETKTTEATKNTAPSSTKASSDKLEQPIAILK